MVLGWHRGGSGAGTECMHRLRPSPCTRRGALPLQVGARILLTQPASTPAVLAPDNNIVAEGATRHASMWLPPSL